MIIKIHLIIDITLISNKPRAHLMSHYPVISFSNLTSRSINLPSLTDPYQTLSIFLILTLREPSIVTPISSSMDLVLDANDVLLAVLPLSFLCVDLASELKIYIERYRTKERDTYNEENNITKNDILQIWLIKLTNSWSYLVLVSVCSFWFVDLASWLKISGKFNTAREKY